MVGMGKWLPNNATDCVKSISLKSFDFHLSPRLWKGKRVRSRHPTFITEKLSNVGCRDLTPFYFYKRRFGLLFSRIENTF